MKSVRVIQDSNIKSVVGYKMLKSEKKKSILNISLTIGVCALTKQALLKELKETVESIELELDSNVCKECSKQLEESECNCSVGGGTDEALVDSKWKLIRFRNVRE